MSEIKQQLTTDIKVAMKAKDKVALGALRSLSGAIKQFEVDSRLEADDEKVLSIIIKQVKQRKDSISQFETAGRDDLVAKETSELEVIGKYLPIQLSEAEITGVVVDVIRQTGASSKADMGKTMGVLKAKLGSSADMAVVSRILKDKLG
jgi:uncharacterized protein YqeY